MAQRKETPSPAPEPPPPPTDAYRGLLTRKGRLWSTRRTATTRLRHRISRLRRGKQRIAGDTPAVTVAPRLGESVCSMFEKTMGIDNGLGGFSSLQTSE